MKFSKTICLLLTLCLALPVFFGCGAAKDDVTLRISVLNGTTGFGMAKLMNDEKDNQQFSFSVETDASVITAGLINGSVDIAALPTNAASVVYNLQKDSPEDGITVLAINTLGVLYVVENGTSIQTIADLDGKTVYCPAQNPAFVLSYIAKKNNIQINIETTYAQPAALMSYMAASPADTIAVLPEPILSVALSKNSNLHTALDLTEEWNHCTGESTLVQGCLVVRTQFLKDHKALVSSFLKEYQASINYLNDNIEETAQMIVDLKIYTGSAALAAKAIPHCNIIYMDGEQMKSALHGFLAAMLEVNPASVGKALPEDDFYYLKNEK